MSRTRGPGGPHTRPDTRSQSMGTDECARGHDHRVCGLLLQGGPAQCSGRRVTAVRAALKALSLGMDVASCYVSYGPWVAAPLDARRASQLGHPKAHRTRLGRGRTPRAITLRSHPTRAQCGAGALPVGRAQVWRGSHMQPMQQQQQQQQQQEGPTRGICHGTGTKGSPRHRIKAGPASSADNDSSWLSHLTHCLCVCNVCRHHTAALPSRQPAIEVVNKVTSAQNATALHAWGTCTRLRQQCKARHKSRVQQCSQCNIAS